MYSIFILILILCLLYHINGNKDKKENFINDMDRVIREKVNNDIDIKAPELPDLGNIQYEIMKQRKPVIEKRTYETGIKNKCKFIAGNKDNMCNDTVYTKFSGASLGIGSNTIQCNGEKMLKDRCKAISLIKNGRLDKVIITHPGESYKKVPKVTINGNAKLKAHMKGGKITKIQILNRGSGYKSSPQIKVEAPNKFNYCNLCCTI